MTGDPRIFGAFGVAKVGSIWRDQDGANWRVVAFSKRGWPVVRNPNGKGSGIETNPAWFKLWTTEREA